MVLELFAPFFVFALGVGAIDHYIGDDDETSSEEEGEETEVVLVGTEADDIIIGTDADETIAGLAGDDILLAGAGNDIVLGGEGDDELELGAGNDVVDPTEANAGDDAIDGGEGDDSVYDWLGSNTLSGGEGDDFLSAWDDIENDTPDNISGDDGDDVLQADDGDTAEGGAGTDSFQILYDEADDESVTIADFDPETETILIYVNEGLEIDQLTDLEFAPGENEEDTAILLDGVQLALVQGQSELNADQVVLSFFS
ncbi:MAG: hypothetical protein ABJO27_09675 [Pseudoruegeria sp.]